MMMTTVKLILVEVDRSVWGCFTVDRKGKKISMDSGWELMVQRVV